MQDHMTAVSGTRLSGTVGGYDPKNPTAAFTGENPYRPNGPMRTIDVNYNITTFVVVPRPQ